MKRITQQQGGKSNDYIIAYWNYFARNKSLGTFNDFYVEHYNNDNKRHERKR